MNVRRRSYGLGLIALLGLGCEDHSFVKVEPICARQVVEKTALRRSKPVDILFVIDDSRTMQEERAQIAANLIARPGCDIANNPDDPNCGFMELMVAAGASQNLEDGDDYYHIGVITTSDSAPRDGGDLLLGPGCLFAENANAAPVITSRDGEQAVELMRRRIAAIPSNGSVFEQGLENIKMLVEGNSPDPRCADHKAQFLRDDARLIIIVITDEDDCSHAPGAPGGLNSTDCYSDNFPKYPLRRYVDALRALKPNPDDVSMAVIAGGVFEPDPARPDQRSVPCAGSVDCESGQICKFHRCAQDTDCSEGRLCLQSEDDPATTVCTPQNRDAPAGLCGAILPYACNRDPAGSNLPTLDSIVPGDPSDRCLSTGGGPGTGCSDVSNRCRPRDGWVRTAVEHPHFCESDHGGRYFELAGQLFEGADGQYLLDSICADDYRRTLTEIASLLILVPALELVEPPADPREMRVTIERRLDDGSFAAIEEVPIYDPDNGIPDGWDLTCDRSCQNLCQDSGVCARRWLRFHGNARPRPGDKLDVRYLTDPGKETCTRVVGSSVADGGPG
ncbi:MAG: hypothetical protein VYB65_02005 [Myxococcota bacterium]|nr:hypothetical protein [Myxococcota bacterium]